MSIFPRDEFRCLVADLLQLPHAIVTWSREPLPFAAPRLGVPTPQRVDLSIVSSREIGEAEYVTESDGSRSARTVRAVRMQIVFYEFTGGGVCEDIAAEFVSALRFPVVTDSLNALGLGYENDSEQNSQEWEEEGRIRSSVVVELAFTFTRQAKPEGLQAGTLERVTIAGGVDADTLTSEAQRAP
jgi:hypothetical protein